MRLGGIYNVRKVPEATKTPDGTGLPFKDHSQEDPGKRRKDQFEIGQNSDRNSSTEKPMRVYGPDGRVFELP